MLRILAPAAKKAINPQNFEDFVFETDNTFIALTLTHIRSKTTLRNNTPLVSNKWFC